MLGLLLQPLDVASENLLGPLHFLISQVTVVLDVVENSNHLLEFLQGQVTHPSFYILLVGSVATVVE